MSCKCDTINIVNDNNIIVVSHADGRDGKSAYQQAVEGGYTGTEQEFNCSLSLLADVAEGKKQLANAINIKGGNASAESSFSKLASDIENLNDSFITYGVTTCPKIDWLKFITTTQTDVRSFVKEIDNDKIEYINTQSCFENCINLTKIRFSNLLGINGMKAFQSCKLLSKIECDNLLTIRASYAFYDCSSLKELNLPNLISITGPNTFTNAPLININIPNCKVLGANGIFKTTSYLRNIVVGTLTSLYADVFGTRMDVLRNFTIGDNTDINLPLYQWTATRVIDKDQSGIDELNNNLRTNLLEKLADHSTD